MKKKKIISSLLCSHANEVAEEYPCKCPCESCEYKRKDGNVCAAKPYLYRKGHVR